MYVCPSCKKVFKVKGNDKNVNCTKCEGMPLLDMHIDEQLWKSYDAMTKDKKISQELEGVVIEEYEENETGSNTITNTAQNQTTQGNNSAIQPKQKKSLICEMCGSTDLMKQEGVFVCQSCGTKYSVEEAKKMMIEGTVDVSGSTVKVDQSQDLTNLFILARRAREEGDSENARKYYEELVIKEPNNWECAFYSSYYKTLGCTVGEIGNAAIKLANATCSSLKLIKDQLNVTDAKEAYMEIANRISNTGNSLYIETYRLHAVNSRKAESMAADALRMVSATGDYIKEIFGDEECALKLYHSAYALIGGHNGYGSDPLSIIQGELKDRIIALEPEYEEVIKKNKEAQKGCYVATAVYGSYDCPQVWTLRRYRDYSLARTWYGRAFIRTYYTISPTLVKWFGHTSWFKKMWRGKLDRMVNSLQDKGYDSTPYDDQNW